MNIYMKKAIAGVMAAAVLIGAWPATGVQADTKPTAETKTTEAVTPTGITKGELESKVDAYLKDYIGVLVPGAAVTIIKDGNVVLSKGYGYNNVEKKNTVDPEKTVFRYENLSQIYTWTAVMQLVEQGKLDLDTDILTYLPEDLSKKLKERLISENPITLTNLMNHTAGFEEKGYNTAFMDSSRLEKNLKDALLVTMPNQVFAPGKTITGDSYSVTLAAYIVELASGMDFTEYVKTNILDKIGAEHTLYLNNEKTAKELGDDLPVVYDRDTQGNFYDVDENYSNLYPLSAVCGTNADLAKLMTNLMQGLENGKLLSKASLDTMYTKSYAICDGAKASLHGLYEYPADVAAFYCDGGTGSTSTMVMMPETGFGVAITTNSRVSLEMLYGLSNYLLVGDKKETLSPVDDLPSVSNVTDREYVGARRSFNGFMEFVGYVGNCSKFSRVDKHTISLGTDEYIQVAPYIYKYAGDNESPLFKTIASTIYFKPDDSTGMGYKWSYSASGTSEYVCSSENKPQAYISITIFLLVAFIIFIVVSALVSIIGLIRDAVKHRFNWKGVRLAYGIFTVLLALTVLNNAMTFSDITSIQGVVSSTINIHMVLNIVLSAFELVSLGYLIVRLRKERQTRMRNLVIMVTAVIYICSIYFLQTWNFYTIIG